MSDLISREEAIKIASGYCHPANIADELAKLPSADEQIWKIAQKCFGSNITYREAVDYVQEVEEQHERYNQ